jgi:hypothetical protein
MADLIFILFTIVFLIVLLIVVLVNVYRAWGSRPVRLEYINNSKSAAEVDLGPYVDILSKQFKETLDN